MDLKQLSQLPSPFYRVTAKALIFDGNNRILVGQLSDGGWEMPGGGLEHSETISECLEREIREELGAEVATTGNVQFIYKGKSIRGWMIIRLAIPVVLKNFDFKFGDMKEARFVDRKELLELNFAADEGTIKNNVDLIWPIS